MHLQGAIVKEVENYTCGHNFFQTIISSNNMNFIPTSE